MISNHLRLFHSFPRTSLDNVDSNIIHTSLDLLLDEFARNLMNRSHAQCVLCRQCSLRGHSIAAMSGDDFLIGFEATEAYMARISFYIGEERQSSALGEFTYAPPELSVPAITRIRFMMCSTICCSYSKGEFSVRSLTFNLRVMMSSTELLKTRILRKDERVHRGLLHQPHLCTRPSILLSRLSINTDSAPSPVAPGAKLAGRL